MTDDALRPFSFTPSDSDLAARARGSFARRPPGGCQILIRLGGKSGARA
ncbi:hypothetical protein [Xanthobacter sp. KR7-225]